MGGRASAMQISALHLPYCQPFSGSPPPTLNRVDVHYMAEAEWITLNLSLIWFQECIEEGEIMFHIGTAEEPARERSI